MSFVARNWDSAPSSPERFGDVGPWTWEVPTLFRGLADPGGPWRAPVAPWLGEDNLGNQIAYWAPLLTLVYGPLGWVRPEVGLRRWLDAGRPADEPALSVLDRWWGPSAAAIVAWSQRSQQLDSYSSVIAEQTGCLMSPPAPAPPVDVDRTMAAVVEGGSDPLHLGHVLDHLLDGPGFGGLPRQRGRLICDPAEGSAREASLLLDRYAGGAAPRPAWEHSCRLARTAAHGRSTSPSPHSATSGPTASPP